MKFTTNLMIGLAIMVSVSALPPAYGQFNPFVQRQPDARTRRALREQAVAYAGPGSRDFVESMGEDAVVAIFGCSPGVARRLADFHACGALAKLPRPGELLQVIGHPGCGDDVALWAIGHHEELTDLDHLQAYLAAPLDYALGLKSLDQGAAAYRAQRLNVQDGRQLPGQLAGADPRWLAGGAGVFGLVVLMAWWKRRQ